MPLLLIASPSSATAVEATVRVDQEYVATESKVGNCAGCGGCACERGPLTAFFVGEV